MEERGIPKREEELETMMHGWMYGWMHVYPENQWRRYHPNTES